MRLANVHTIIPLHVLPFSVSQSLGLRMIATEWKRKFSYSFHLMNARILFHPKNGVNVKHNSEPILFSFRKWNCFRLANVVRQNRHRVYVALEGFPSILDIFSDERLFISNTLFLFSGKVVTLSVYRWNTVR